MLIQQQNASQILKFRKYEMNIYIMKMSNDFLNIRNVKKILHYSEKCRDRLFEKENNKVILS